MPRRITVPNTFGPIDEAIDRGWDTIRGNRLADRIFYTASEAANFSLIWHALGVTRAIVERNPRRAIRTSAALAIESALVNGPIKSLFERDRPAADAADRPHHLRQPRTSSFPSGHASAAVVATSFLTENTGRFWKAAVRAVGFVVATSRVHVRIHHFTDVVAGAATGWVLAKAIRRVLRW